MTALSWDQIGQPDSIIAKYAPGLSSAALAGLKTFHEPAVSKGAQPLTLQPAASPAASQGRGKRITVSEPAPRGGSISRTETGKPAVPAELLDGRPAPDIVCLAEIAAKDVNWLWKLYLAFGMLAMLSGDPGAGKTFIALAIAAGFTKGRTPDGERCDPIAVLYLSVENAPAEVIRPRFDSLGGDAKRFYLLRGSTWEQEGETVQGTISLSDVGILDKALIQTGAKLIIVDPIQSYLGANIDLHRSNETRPVLDGLAKLAEKYGCAVLILRHLSKQGGGKAITRGLGSIDLTGAVRSEMLAGALPDDPDTHALVHIKTNLGPYGSTRGYSIDSEGRFAWTGESGVTAGDLLAEPARPGDRKLTEASEWLRAELSNGPREQCEVRERAETRGISYASLRRAKSALRVRSFHSGMKAPWMWALPDPEDVQKGSTHEKLSTFAKLSTFEDAQPTKKLNITPLNYEDAQNYVCEHVDEHLQTSADQSTLEAPDEEDERVIQVQNAEVRI